MTVSQAIGFIILALFIGIIVGMLLYFKIVHKSGIMHVNINEPDRDVFRIEYLDDLDLMAEKKYIIFKVKKH